MLQHVLRSRSVLWLLVSREFRTRYAGSNLGALWNIIHPLVLIGIYVLVFSKLMGGRMGASGSRLTYTIHLCAGMIPWFLFSEIITRSSNVLIENSNMLKKMTLPEEVLFLSVFFTSTIVHSISMLALMLILTIMGAPLTPIVFFAFPVMILLGLSAVGIGMALSVATLLVRDLGQMVQIALQVGFWSLPIVYIPSILPEKLAHIALLNPFRGFFTLTQLLFGSPEASFASDAYWMMVLLPFASIAIGMSIVKRSRSEVLDSI